MSIKKQLKIFVDGYLLNKEHQGTKTYIRELYKEFAIQNPNVSIYIGCFKDLDIEKEFIDQKNIKFIYFKSSNRVFRMLFEIPKIIKSNKFDYAHFQYVIPLQKSTSCKYIVTIHDILFNDYKKYFSKSYRFARNILFKYSAKNADFLLTVSKYSKERLQFHYNITQKEIFITPNGVCDTYFQDIDKQDSRDYIFKKYNIQKFILYVSRIEPRKNQQTLLKAFLEIDQKDTSLVFIGVKSIDNKEFDAILDNLNQDQKRNIHLIQGISDKDLFYFLNAAKMFVYPTIAEGFGIPPLEAAALKTPVICSNKTAMIEYDFFGENLIDIDNFEQLKLRIQNLLVTQNQTELEKIQKAIKMKYTWKKSSDVISNIISNY